MAGYYLRDNGRQDIYRDNGRHDITEIMEDMIFKRKWKTLF